jgi:hypothetical protein
MARLHNRACCTRNRDGGHVRQGLALVCAIAVLNGLFLLTGPAHAQERKPGEYDVKAAYLYNFGWFVNGPATLTPATDNAFPVCILGHDPFGPILDETLANETTNGRSLLAKRIAKAADATDCRIVFISNSEAARLKELLETMHKMPVLTVSDIPEFAKRGGMIGFVTSENRVRFEVNTAAASDAGLTLSAELLKVAVAVRKDRDTKN